MKIVIVQFPDAQDLAAYAVESGVRVAHADGTVPAQGTVFAKIDAINPEAPEITPHTHQVVGTANPSPAPVTGLTGPPVV